MTTIKADTDDLAIDPEYYDQIERKIAARESVNRRKQIRREQQQMGLKSHA